jgi:hypothetical protein
MKRQYTRPFVGIKEDGSREVVRATNGNALKLLGFVSAVGPFRTTRGANWHRDHGKDNPLARTVAESERRALTAHLLMKTGSADQRKGAHALDTAQLGSAPHVLDG